MDIKDILARCDHTLLRTDCTAAEIRALCDDAIRFGCASVCIPPAHVAGAKRYVNGQMKICTVIGFPNGYNTTAAKVFETEDAVKNGADMIVSSDIRHHILKDILARGMAALCPTHYAAEAYGFYLFYKKIAEAAGIPCFFFGNDALL